MNQIVGKDIIAYLIKIILVLRWAAPVLGESVPPPLKPQVAHICTMLYLKQHTGLYNSLLLVFNLLRS